MSKELILNWAHFVCLAFYFVSVWLSLAVSDSALCEISCFLNWWLSHRLFCFPFRFSGWLPEQPAGVHASVWRPWPSEGATSQCCGHRGCLWLPWRCSGQRAGTLGWSGVCSSLRLLPTQQTEWEAGACGNSCYHVSDSKRWWNGPWVGTYKLLQSPTFILMLLSLFWRAELISWLACFISPWLCACVSVLRGVGGGVWGRSAHFIIIFWIACFTGVPFSSISTCTPGDQNFIIIGIVNQSFL